MKAISLTQPWASLVACGYKRIETRSWSTNYRGMIAIHAAKSFPRWAREFAEDERSVGRVTGELPLGAIVAVCRLLDIKSTHDIEPSALERHLGDYTPGRCAWLLDEVAALDEPIICRGALGLWTVPEDIAADVLIAEMAVRHGTAIANRKS